MQIARLASVLSLATGVILGLGLLFGPFFYGCATRAVEPGQTPAPEVCSGSTRIEVHGSEHLFTSPLLWILMWSLAPVLALIAVCLSRCPRNCPISLTLT